MILAPETDNSSNIDIGMTHVMNIKGCHGCAPCFNSREKKESIIVTRPNIVGAAGQSRKNEFSGMEFLSPVPLPPGNKTVWIFKLAKLPIGNPSYHNMITRPYQTSRT